MRRRLLPWAALCLLATLSAAGGAEKKPTPHWAVDADGYLTMSQLPALLDDATIEDHLTSGLTTSFVLSAATRSGSQQSRVQGGARIDVRYELWDELFQVLIVTPDAASEHYELASMDELRQWWRTLEIRLLHIGAIASTARRPVRITLEVVPFSRSEQLDAQRWLTEAATRAGSTGANRPPEKSESTGGITELLMATSIGRRALLTRRWQVELDDLPRSSGVGRG